ncbi:MAG: Fic family protein [Akkermansia sp.]|nr:Fic family protein [Akkermansia sp.]
MYTPCFIATPRIFATLNTILNTLGNTGVAAEFTESRGIEWLQRAHAEMGGSGAFRSSPPCPHWVPVLVQALLEWLHTSPTHPIIRAALFHFELVQIRPFDAGNEALAASVHGKLLASFHKSLGKVEIPAVSTDQDAAAYVEHALQRMQEQLEASTRQPGRDTLLSPAERKLVEYLQQNPGSKRQDILAAIPRLSARVLDRHLQHLRETGCIEYRGSRKTGAYYPCS